MRRSILLLLPLMIFLVSCEMNSPNEPNLNQEASLPANGTPIDNQYIVVMESSLDGVGLGRQSVTQAVQSILADQQISSTSVSQVYASSIRGFALTASTEEIQRVANDERVAYVEQDRYMILAKPPWAGGGGGDPEPSGQTTPWGITRVGGGVSSNGTAWILDTGVDLDHPDLNVDVARSASFISNGPESDDPNDRNGHGSHVAGTIAAIDNDIDVVGVAAGATVVAVKVLDRRGSGSYSSVVAGVDYVAANGSNGDVANMSLSGPVSQALDDAVANAAASGVKFALAAGNEGTDANGSSPARVNGNNIYTVSAINVDDIFASWSNYGNPPVDYAAPGVGILSTWKNGDTNTISGTSMAAPHVAGLLLLGQISSDGTAIGDPDGDPDPIAHN